MLAFDAIGAMATGHADISEVMFAQGLIITAIIIQMCIRDSLCILLIV